MSGTLPRVVVIGCGFGGLEAVRLLSNFETSSQKLMQILLVGQPELRDTLYSADFLHRRGDYRAEQPLVGA